MKHGDFYDLRPINENFPLSFSKTWKTVWNVLKWGFPKYFKNLDMEDVKLFKISRNSCDKICYRVVFVDGFSVADSCKIIDELVLKPL